MVGSPQGMLGGPGARREPGRLTLEDGERPLALLLGLSAEGGREAAGGGRGQTVNGGAAGGGGGGAEMGDAGGIYLKMATSP